MQAIWLRRSGNWIEQHPLLFALGISLAVHVVLFTLAATVLGVALLRDPDLLKQIAQSPERIIELTAQQFDKTPPPELKPPEQEKQMPMLFIEVDPSQTVKDTPDKSKYYAAQNTLAANPDTKLDTDTPKIEGKQTQIIRAFDAAKAQPKAMPLQPSPAQAKVEAQPQKNTPQSEQAAKSQKKQDQSLQELAKQERGDLEKLRPVQTKQEQKNAVEESVPPARPKTLAEAKARQSDHRPPGEKMQQEGGVKRLAATSSLQASATPLGQYDAILIDAIREAWFGNVRNKTFGNQGRVDITFRLHANGRISDLHVINSTVDSILTSYCEIAIEKPSPFPPWPNEVKRELGANFRDIRFSFHYN
jgi:outer membrane biosynthesis protein TonB